MALDYTVVVDDGRSPSELRQQLKAAFQADAGDRDSLVLPHLTVSVFEGEGDEWLGVRERLVILMRMQTHPDSDVEAGRVAAWLVNHLAGDLVLEFEDDILIERRDGQLDTPADGRVWKRLLRGFRGDRPAA